MALGNDIIQTPFQPLTDTASSQAVQTSPVQGLEALFGENYKPSPQALTANADKQLLSMQQEQSSFMPTFLATMAALTGNFGPRYTASGAET